MPTSTAHRNRAAATGAATSKLPVDDSGSPRSRSWRRRRTCSASSRPPRRRRRRRSTRARRSTGSCTAPTTGCWSSSGPARSTTRGGDGIRRAASRRSATRLADDLVIVMRVYFEKPRTTVGWKGLINDPRPRRQLQDQRGPAPGAPAAGRSQRARPAGRHRVPRHDHAAVHRRPDRLGRHRRAHHREPGAPRTGVAACPARSASRTAPTATCGSRSTPSRRRRRRTTSCR